MHKTLFFITKLSFQMKNFNKILLGAALFATGTVMAQDFPPNAVPGNCYAKCVIPEQYETVTEEVLVKEASTRIEVAPATYRTAEEQILVKDGYTVLTVTPPQYNTVTEEVMVKEASSRLRYVPPTYETVTEQMLISPATTKWVKNTNRQGCESANPNDCNIWCLREVPAQYKTVSRQVLRTPATTEETPVPAEYKTVTRTVVQTPAQVMENSVPPEYRTITKQVLDVPAQANTIAVPAEYRTMTTRQLVSPGGYSEWRQVNCSTNYSTTQMRSYVRDVQNALIARGYNVGTAGADNVMGSDTRNAIMKFQKDNGLAVGVQGNNIPVETLDALGVKNY